MKTIIKLLIAVVILNAAYRCGRPALAYYQFKDEAQQMVLFGQGLSVEDLTRQILDEGAKRGVPLDPEGLNLRREGTRTVAEATYVENIELFPRYFYPLTFSFSVEGYGFAGAAPAPRPRPKP